MNRRKVFRAVIGGIVGAIGGLRFEAPAVSDDEAVYDSGWVDLRSSETYRYSNAGISFAKGIEDIARISAEFNQPL